MTRLTYRVLVFGLFVFLNVAASSTNAEINGDTDILECFYEKNSLECAKKRADTELDAIEAEVSGRQSSVAFSKVLEEAGTLVVDGTRSLFGQSDETEDNIGDNDDKEDESISELPRKKFGKKKKKMLQKLLAFSMLIKSKISLLLQLISTHFQLKFFVIAVISLVINVARFWIDLKKEQHPAKVIYYGHAQHQHHYDHEDYHGDPWGRSEDTWPAHELAYGLEPHSE